MYDVTYMKYLCQIHRQKVEWWLPREKENDLFNGYRVSVL